VSENSLIAHNNKYGLPSYEGKISDQSNPDVDHYVSHINFYRLLTHCSINRVIPGEFWQIKDSRLERVLVFYMIKTIFTY